MLAGLAALLLLSACKPAADEVAAPGIPRPAFRIHQLGHGIQMPPGSGLAFDGSDELFWRGYDEPTSADVSGRWNPKAERFEPFPVPPGVVVEAAAAWEHGWYLLGQDGRQQAVVIHVARQRSGQPGDMLSTRLAVARHSARLLALSDGSALVVGGLLPGDVRTRKVERVRLRGGALSVSPAADVPGPAKGVSYVALSDGRAMALGGTDEAYLDCQSCSAATRVYDPATNTWTAGSNMLQARSHASATLLPDGSVLVAGGWTPGFGWQTTASATSERWNPKTQAFESAAPLPVGMAGQQATWATGLGNKVLLLSGGWYKAWEGAQATLAYDVASGTWRTAGEHCPAESRAGHAHTGSIHVNGHLLQWCLDDKATTAKPLRWPLPAPADAQGGFAPVRGEAAFAPARMGRPALVIGGAYAGGVPTAAVDAMAPDGQVQAFAPLNVARFAASAFSLDAGTVVVGGQAYHRGRPDEPLARLPLEWLPADAASARGWTSSRLLFAPEDVFARAGESALLALRTDGRLERLDITARGTELVVASVPLPPPPRVRTAGPDRARIAMRRLDDGRIIVAGGLLQTDALALFGPQALRDDVPDRYVPDGPHTPWTDYDTFDPASGRWQRSAAAGTEGGLPLILADGRVLKLTFDEMASPQAEDGSWPVTKPGVLEISNKDGTQWVPFASPAPLIRLDPSTRLFELEGVLLVSGQDPRLRTGSPRRLLALDPSDGAWKSLWEARPDINWRALQGRVVLVTLPGGRRAAVPVEGL